MNYKVSILKSVPIISLILVFFVTSPAYSQDDKTPILIVPDDIYNSSNVPVHINFKVEAFDYQGNSLKVDCDRYSGQLFNVGKTTVRCMAVDSNKVEVRSSFVVTVGYTIVKIPSWVKIQTGWWSENKISDDEFANNLRYLLDKKIIHIPLSHIAKSNTDMTVPSWIKSNSQKWVNGTLGDEEFSMGIQWLVQKRVIESEFPKTTR